MSRWWLGLSAWVGVACVQPRVVEWPTAERGQAIVSILLQDGEGRAAGPWAGLPTLTPALVVAEDQRWLISEYQQTFEELQLEPPVLPLAAVATPSAGLTLDHEVGLARPARSWRSVGPAGDFVEEAPEVLPVELRGVWARDLACPRFESHLAMLPAPLKLILPHEGHAALGVSEDGRHFLIAPHRVTPLVVEGWPGERVGFGAWLGPGRLAISTSEGAVLQGTIRGGTVRYEAPVRPFDAEPTPEIRGLTGDPEGERVVVAGLHGAVAIIRAGTSTVVHHLYPDPIQVIHHRLVWTEAGEVLGLFRQAGLAHKGVWRMSLEPTPRVSYEQFGTSTLDTPNEIARIQGEWTIAGSRIDLRDEQGVFRNRGRGWERYAMFDVTLRVESLADAPGWDGVVFATREGARVGAQARLGRGRACPEVSYRPQQVNGGDVIGLVVLDDGRVIAALEHVPQILILRPQRPWLGP